MPARPAGAMRRDTCMRSVRPASREPQTINIQSVRWVRNTGQSRKRVNRGACPLISRCFAAFTALYSLWRTYKRVGSYRVGVETVLQRSSRRESHNDPRSIVRLWSVSDFRDESAVQARRARSQAGFSQISRRDRREVLERVALPVSGLVGDPHPMNENSKTISGRAGRLSPHPERRRRGSPKAGRHQQSV